MRTRNQNNAVLALIFSSISLTILVNLPDAVSAVLAVLGVQ